MRSVQQKLGHLNQDAAHVAKENTNQEMQMHVSHLGILEKELITKHIGQCSNCWQSFEIQEFIDGDEEIFNTE